MLKLYAFVFFLLLGILFPAGVNAETNNKFINIVNPVRMSTYAKDPIANVKSQYKVVSSLDLSATWLLTYDVLSNPEMIGEFKKSGAKYIYAAKYGDYVEKVPFSPGDLGVVKIYDNANSEVWRVE